MDSNSESLLNGSRAGSLGDGAGETVSASHEPNPKSAASIPLSLSRPSHVIGVAASAGGLEALEHFFEQMPPDRGLAFVVVQHLSPDFRSLMDELLARHTKLAIYRVEEGMRVEQNSLYLIPPKKELVIREGCLHLMDRGEGLSPYLPADIFFRSLAEDVGQQAIAVVLSGTGSDGSRGIQAIHEAGGLVIAQQEDTAKFDGMPRAAIETGVVSYVLPPSAMAEVILDHVTQPLGQALLPRTTIRVGVGGDPRMETVFALLRDRYQIDFAHYKSATVLRRIDRRATMTQSIDLDDYVRRLSNDTHELSLLYHDLLIGVTQFFRDPDAFHFVQRRILPMLNEHVASGGLRIWVPGCATGEEAYSLAILFHEAAEQAGRTLNFKVFATDVHEESLGVAASGVYTAESVLRVSPDRLQRYFVQRGSDYQVTKELRQSIVFARHNILRDAPFTRIDLISCRNLLIYFEPAAQHRVLSLFHFALRAQGILFLGPSESPGQLADEFEPLEKHWRVYRKKRQVRLPASMRVTEELTSGDVCGNHLPPPSGRASGTGSDVAVLRAYDALLDKFAPPGLLITDKRELIHSFGEARKLLHPPAGRSSTDVLDMVDSDLRLAIGGAVSRVCKQKSSVIYRGVRVVSDSGEQYLTLQVEPLPSRDNQVRHLLISFTDMATPVIARDLNTDDFRVGDASRHRIDSMETELRYTRENLQATIEELETSNEELQATNEELVSSNEELQSTNEELHSVNEELYTVNAEYQRKIDELTELTNDMDNLLASTDIGTVFLDRQLRIRKFTPEIEKSFHLLPQDVGRPISHLAHNIMFDGLLEKVTDVLLTGSSFEQQVASRDGVPLLMRIRPYRSGAAEAAGVVLTFVDISTLRQAEESLRRIEWLLTKPNTTRSQRSHATAKRCEAAASSSHDRLLVDSLGEEVLRDIVGDYLDLLDTTAAVHERNGEFALWERASNWCRMLEENCQGVCRASNSGTPCQQRHCEESCSKPVARRAMETGEPVDAESCCGMRMYAVPIRAGDEMLGAICVGYGDPPREPTQLQVIADRCQVSLEDLRREAAAYDSRPPFIVEIAKIRLQTSAKLIGAMVEARRAQDSLRQLAVIVRDSPDAITVHNLDGQIVAWNHGAEKSYGWTEAEALRMNIREMIPVDRLAEMNTVQQQLQAGGAVEAFETQRRTRSGGLIDMWLTVTAIVDDAGMVQAIATSGRDITARARAARQLRETADELARSNRELEQFAYFASHDLKEPLRMVSAYTALLAERYRGQLDDEADKYIHYASEGASRMQSLVDALLAYARVGRRETSNEQVDLTAVVEQAIANLEATVQELQATVEVEPLPQCHGDPSALTQLFQNLIANGLKFNGAATPRVCVFRDPAWEPHHIAVRDNGIGIAPEYHERIFGLFQRLHARDEYAGTGIGLAICKKIVERHGGRIWLESELGRGSCFHIEFPSVHATAEP